MAAPGFESGRLGSVIRPVGHASTPHTTAAVTTPKQPAPKPPPWLNSASLTPAQMDTQATNEANASIAPQVQGLQSQQAADDARAKAYEAAMTGFYSALAPYIKGISGDVSAAYNSAATAMGDIGHGYAGVLGADAAKNTADANAALARAGQAPLAAPGSGLTDAFAATHGGIQGTSFAEEGAAKASAAAQLPGTWAAQGRDSMTEAINKAVAGDAAWASKIENVYSTVPALRATILHQVQQAEIAKQQLKDTEQTLGINQQKATQTYKEKLATLKAQEAHWNQQSADTNRSITQRAADAKAARDVRVQIAKLNAANKTAKSTTKFKSPQDVAVAVQKEVTYLHAHPTGYAPPPPGSLPGVKGAPIYQSWQSVANSMFSSYITPYLKSLPANKQPAARAELKTALINAMTQAGFVKP